MLSTMAFASIPASVLINTLSEQCLGNFCTPTIPLAVGSIAEGVGVVDFLPMKEED